MNVSTNIRPAKSLMERTKRAMSPSQIKRATRVAANDVKRELESRTPVFTGKTKKSWVVSRRGHGWAVYNKTLVAEFLDKGTKAHGAVGGGLLFVPRTVKARKAGVKGIGRLKRGKDFVMVKRVRGIKAKKILQISKIRKIYRERMEGYINKAVR